MVSLAHRFQATLISVLLPLDLDVFRMPLTSPLLITNLRAKLDDAKQ
jgi:hypothetical protein